MNRFKLPRSSVTFVALAVALFGLVGPSRAQLPARVPSRAVIEEPGGPITSISFSPSGRLLLVTEDGQFLRIWDLESRTQRHVIGHEKAGNRMKLWDDVPGGGRHLIREEDVDPREVPPEHRLLRGRDKSAYYPPIDSLSISSGFVSDDRHILLQVQDELHFSVCPDTVTVYDLETHGLESICTTADDGSGFWEIGQCEWSRRGNVMAFAASYLEPRWHSDILIHDRDTRQVVARIVGGGIGLTGYYISNTGNMIATHRYARSSLGLHGGYLDVWNARTGERLGRAPTEANPFGEPIFSPQDRDLAAVCGRSADRIVIWDTDKYRVKHVLKDRRKVGFGIIRYTPDGKYLVSSMLDGTLSFWDTRDYHEVLQGKLMSTGAASIEISPDGKTLCALSDSQFEKKLIRIYDMDQFLTLIPKSPATR